MDDKQSQGVEETSSQLDVQENQLEPAPSSEQKQAEENIDQVEATDQGDNLEQDQSDGINPRTEQRIKELLEENRKLKAEKSKNNYGTSVFDQFRPKEVQQGPVSFTDQNQQTVDSITQQYIDQDGNVDINGLNKALQEANLSSRRAIIEAERIANERIARFEEKQQVREAHEKYPQLDPISDKFDPNFYELVSNRLLGQMVQGTGNQETLAQAAEYIGKIYNITSTETVNLDKVKTEAVTEYKQTQKKRQQGPIEQGHGQSRTPTADLDDLRSRTRQGDPNAIQERLKRLGIISND